MGSRSSSTCAARSDAAHHAPYRAGFPGLCASAGLDRARWAVGRLYEDGSLNMPPELRWFWSVVVYVPPAAGIVTSGKVPTLEGAKAQFEAALRQWLEWAKLSD
jgi:hypothetical protein